MKEIGISAGPGHDLTPLRCFGLGRKAPNGDREPGMKKAYFPAVTVLLMMTSVFLAAGKGEEEALREARLKAGLRQAVVFSLESELKRYEQRRDETKLAEMREALARFLALKPEDIPLPKGPETEPGPPNREGYGIIMPPLVREVEVVPGGPLEPGSVLEVVGMTKSGPFYHLAGAEKEALESVRSGADRRLILYLVFKREYFGFIPNYYVYAAGARKTEAPRENKSKES